MPQGIKGKKVYVGLSGGVDSSVAAALLKDAGYDVTGVFIKVWQPDWIHCTWKEDRLDAMRVCAALRIPFVTLDLEKEYKKEVVDYMIDEYKAGRTPNPDVMCNKYVKFGSFFNWAMTQGADFVATGHYAQVKMIDGHTKLFAAKDSNKDQSYFLWTLTAKELTHTLFPVGNLEKPEVRKLAEKYNLITADKKDSQGLCFIGKVDMKEFLKAFIPSRKGKVLTVNGEVIGEHDGAVFYTIGERHGFTITHKTTHDKPYYVVSKNNKENTITVSNTPTTEKAAIALQTFSIHKTNWIDALPPLHTPFLCRTRYREQLLPCTITAIEKDKAIVTLQEVKSTLTSGQSFVMYKNDECIGGGIIA